MGRLLDTVKESGLSHEEVVDLIEKDKALKLQQESEITQDPEIEVEGNVKPEDEAVEDEVVEEDEIDEETKALVSKLADEKEAKDKADKVKIAELVQDELKRRGKVKRKTPSKGSITDVPKLNYELNSTGYAVNTNQLKQKNKLK